MLSPKSRGLLPVLFFLGLSLLQAQGGSDGAGSMSITGDKDNPVSFIGMKLEELIGRFGVPLLVYPARGREEWQDDVVFVYEQGNFYIYRDRIWQVGLKEAGGVKLGDPRAVVLLVLGSPGGETRGDSVFYPLNDGAWPLVLRIDFDSDGRVKAIFIYRSDF